MKRAVKFSAATILVLTLITVALFSPALPWSARMRQNLNRFVVRAEARMARLQGKQTRMVSLRGRLAGIGAQVESLKGARVFAIESISGYTALTDATGRFILPHITFYPGAVYNLVVLSDLQTARQFTLTAPDTQSDVIDFGEVDFKSGSDISYKNTPVRYMRHDIENNKYYREVFDRLTAELRADEEKIDAICRHIAARLVQNEKEREFESPREIIEQGGNLCSHLALAMAAITEAGNYPTRTVHTSDSVEHRNTHVVVEVYYKNRWHLYDPTYGAHFLNRRGSVASYKELRLDPDLLTPEAFRGLRPRTVQDILGWMRGTYRSGYHQIYQVNRDDLCVVW